VNPRISHVLTFGLAGVVALLLVLLASLWFGVGRGYSWWPLDPAGAAVDDKKLANPQFRLGDWEKFAEITARPLFNEDRKPTPPMSPETQSGPSQVRKLDVVLSGVIITSKLHLAMVKEKGKEKSMSVKEGAALPGDWAAWSLAELKPRTAVFKNSAGESETLELIAVASSQKPTPPPPPHVTPPAPAAMQPPPPPPPPTSAMAPPITGQAPVLPTPTQPGVGGDAASAAAATALDLQQRIDARRQQIREQQQQQQQERPTEPIPVMQQRQ